VQHIKDQCLPGYEFRGLPELTVVPQDEDDDAYRDEEYR
jgi:hypothetical protein